MWGNIAGLHAIGTVSLVLCILQGTSLSHGQVARAAALSDGDVSIGEFEGPLPRALAHIQPRYVIPSTDEIVAMIDKNNVMGSRNSVFWTSFAYVNTPIMQQGYMTTKTWARQRFHGNCNFVMYDQSVSDEDFEILTSSTIDDMPSTAQDRDRVEHFSKAFARRSTGTVYILIPDGKEPYDDSIWKKWEAPVLTRTGKVDEIIRVGWPSKEETSIWKRGQDALYEPAPPGKL